MLKRSPVSPPHPATSLAHLLQWVCPSFGSCHLKVVRSLHSFNSLSCQSDWHLGSRASFLVASAHNGHIGISHNMFQEGAHLQTRHRFRCLFNGPRSLRWMSSLVSLGEASRAKYFVPAPNQSRSGDVPLKSTITIFFVKIFWNRNQSKTST